MKLHAGQDYSGEGPIMAAADGIVTKIGYAPSKRTGFGHYLIITHSSNVHQRGYATLYAHMARATFLKVGDRVLAGKSVGIIGSTGASTGPHLHFELRHNGKPIDPAPYMTNAFRAGLPVTGRLDKATIREFQSYLKQQTYYRGLLDGELGPQTIRAIQTWTNEGTRKPGIGYSMDYIRVDGIMGPATRRAIQKKLGVTQDGILGRETISRLQTYLNGARPWTI